MTGEEKKEALESIKLIKELVTQTEREMYYSGGGWISVIWGIFCIVGFTGQRLIAHLPPSRGLKEATTGIINGLFWIVLSLIAVLATYFVVKRGTAAHSQKRKHYLRRGFFLFWIPLILLAYVLGLFCVFSPDLPARYIPVFILLVISTGFLIIGFLFQKEILAMGVIGFTGTILTAIFFIAYADVILGLLFGIGLIVTGTMANRRFEKKI